MDPSLAFEIDRVLEVSAKEALLIFVGDEQNARWVSREDLK